MKAPVILLLLTLSLASSAQPYATPDELVSTLSSLRADACDLACSRHIAGMYTDQFLSNQREVVLQSFENQATRREMMMNFFGQTFDIRRLRAMSLTEFFGRQLWHNSKSVPLEYLMTRTEIVSREQVTDNRIEAQVVYSGMAADPKYREEGAMTFVRQNGSWKIDRQF